MFEKWISIENNIGKIGSEGGPILIDEELPKLARVTIEKKTSPKPLGTHYAITMGVYGMLVHTAFFKKWDDAIECTETVKILIETLFNNLLDK
jgi:hypothetical protein